MRSCRRSVAQHPCAIQVDIVAMAAFISSFAGAQLAHARPSKQTALRAALTLPGTAETNLAVPSNAVRKVQPYPIAKPPSYSSVDSLRPARVSRMDADWATIYEQVRRQVMGNAYVMEGEAPDIDVAFSQLKGGNLTVREFVRAVGKSASYRTRFMEAKSSYNFVLLNFKHFLGRAPTQEEVSTHIQILATSGLEAEIDSYIDSDEYKALFGDHVVPYVVYRGTYLSSERFNRMVKANPGGATSDKAKSNLNMIATVAADLPTDAIDVMRGLPSPITSETLAFGTAYYWAKVEKEASEGRSASPIGEKIGKFDHAPISTYTSLCSYDKVNKAPQISVTNVGSDEHSYVSVTSKYIAPDMAAAAQMLADCQKYKAGGNAPTGKWMKYYPGTTVNMAPYISLNDTGSDSSRTVSVTLDKVKIS
nr:Chain Y7, Phycobilisome 31.8 kDa linker polypeptide, phycoerythrin-associated, rod [Porphyridium purpureum]7Y4L_b7 Chain b7, Phycobilisome 31.8 kDa linker polypeptide, phycoerythrin-associated, rod [Porphyridium purpureum]